jgi:phosphoglycolate phosphatase-like HAD superfamily hydrolase
MMTETQTKLPCFVFDIDGTLSDCSHRAHHVKYYPKNWASFNSEMVNDSLIESTSVILAALSFNYTIILVTGRPESYRGVTEEWLKKHGIEADALYMRDDEDFRQDDEYKSEIADLIEETYSIMGVFEDRKRVVDMWKSRGIVTYDCSNKESMF